MSIVSSHIAATTRDPEKRERIEAGKFAHLGKSTRGRPRKERIASIGKRLTERWERQRFRQSPFAQIPQEDSTRAPLRRKERTAKPRLKPIVAYDLETTSIKRGTPRPLYITGCGADFWVSSAVRDVEHLHDILVSKFLLPELKGTRFVAWNGNNFDVFFIAAALMYSNDFVVRPYMTKSKNLRGLKVISKDDGKTSWEFLDGCSMTVGAPQPLKKFLSVFAPEYQKLDGPDFEREEFNAKNPQHVAYAERDSEGLYHALMKVQSIILENFNIGLQPTIGNLGIKIFQAHIPHEIAINEPPREALNVIRDYVMRGGFCFAARKYEGPVWKYDINQAYAAAMRESDLPAGRCISIKGESKYAKCAIYRVTATNPRNTVPFYYREIETGKSVFGINGITDTWITSQELKQLRAENWNVQVKEGYYFDDSFRMKDYVNKLERLRLTGEGGPKGAQGIVMKSIGNNSYGKTVERLDGIEYLIANSKPEGFSLYPTDSDFAHVWFRFNKPATRPYHQPQLGAFITAHVRMVLRRAILKAPEAWLYADTDCTIFSKPVDLPIDEGEYGKWKKEADGKNYRIITKKVYADFGANEKHCKGLNVKRLTDADFVAWYNGEPPRQKMTHRQNFILTMQGADMFVDRERVGERKIAPKKSKEKALAI